MQGFPPSVQLMGIGWYVALTIILGVVGGVYLDKAVGSDPVFALLGLALGLVLAFWGGYLQLRDTLDSITSRSREKKQ